MIQNPETSQARFPYIKTIHHSSVILSVSPITLYSAAQKRQSIVFAKSSCLEFYHIIKGSPVYSHTVELYCKVTAMLVIPTRHKWSDSIFIADDQNRFTIYRPTETEGLEVVLKRKYEFDEECLQMKPTINVGIYYHFNSNDTEGYLYYSLNNDIVVTSFLEKLDGFHEVSNHACKLPPNSTLITHLPKSKTRYKKETLAILYIESTANKLGVFDIELNQYPSSLRLQNPNTVFLSIFGGTELVVVDSFEISLYSYDFGNLIASYKQPVTNSITKIISLQNVYCGIGDQLIIFNKTGITRYGDYEAVDAMHITDNRLITWHSVENTKYIELTENSVELIEEWVNLGPIAELNSVDIDGTQTYLINSPAKNKPISILSDAIGFRTLVSSEIEGRIKNIFKLEGEVHYLLVQQFFKPTLILKINADLSDPSSLLGNNVLEEIGILEEQPLLTYQRFIITKENIYTYSQTGLVKYHNFKQPISKASISPEGYLVVEVSHRQIQHFSIFNVETKGEISIEKQLSVLLSARQESGSFWIGYCCWGSRRLYIVSKQQSLKIKLLRQAKSLYKSNNHLYIGYSQGKIQIYSANSYNKLEEFSSSTTPISRFIEFNTNILAFSAKSCIISQNSLNLFVKKDVMLQNISGFIQTTPNSSIYIISKHNKLEFISPNLSQNMSVKSLNIKQQKDQKICTIYPFLYVFSPFRVHTYDLKNLQNIKQYHIDLASISCGIETYLEKYILASGKSSVDYSIILWGGEYLISKLTLKKQPLIIKVINQSYGVIGFQNQLKFIAFEKSSNQTMAEEDFKIQIVDHFSFGIDIIPYAIDVLPKHNKMIVADSIRSLNLCSYNLEKRSFVILSKFSVGSLGLEVAFLGNYILESDVSDNLYLLSGNLGSQNQLQRTALSFNGGIHLNESIWTMKQCIDKNTNTPSLVYGTNNGTIGKITLIPEQCFNQLKELQKRISKLSSDLSFKTSKSLLSPSHLLLSLFGKNYERLKTNCNRRFNMSENNLINGDMIEILCKSTQIRDLVNITNIGEDQKSDIRIQEIRRLIQNII